MGRLFIGIREGEERSFREWSRHELNSDRESVGGEPRRHRHGREPEDGTQAPVAADSSGVEQRVVHVLRANLHWLVVKGRVHQRIEIVICHQAEHRSARVFGVQENLQVGGIFDRLADAVH